MAGGLSDSYDPAMPRYLYVFGFESPQQIRDNDRLGSDHEDSQAVWIVAPSEVAALEWGRELSERFVHHLSGDGSVSWKARGYAHWIEAEPQTRFGAEALAGLPEIRIGDVPDFTDW